VWDAQSSRDVFIYAANCLHSGVDAVLQLIADTSQRPLLTDDEVCLSVLSELMCFFLQLTSARRIVTVDTADMNSRMDVEAILTDWIHAAAFRANTLGLPKICAEGDADKITRDHLLAFLSRHFVPERMVVVGECMCLT
jgi:processing peptidase subunit alpha